MTIRLIQKPRLGFLLMFVLLLVGSTGTARSSDSQGDSDKSLAHHLEGKRFVSIKELEMGLGPDGKEVLGHWSIEFKDGQYSWDHSDTPGSGAYTILENGVIKPDRAPINAFYNTVTHQLIWDDVTYQAEHENVPGWVTGLFLVILIGMIAALAFEEKLHAKKSIIVGVTAGICLVLITVISNFLNRELLPFGHITLPNGHSLGLPVYIPAIEWEVITIILGASLFVEVTSRSGVFTWMAIKLTKKSGGDPFKLLVFYGLLTVIFSAVLNNVTAMIIIGSLTGVSLKKLKREDLLLGFLLVEGFLTNVGGLLTLISSVPNIIVGKTAGIEFIDFFIIAAPYVALATAATLFMGKWKFKIKGLSGQDEKQLARELVDTFDENEMVSSKKFFWYSVGALVLFIAVLSCQSWLPCGLSKLEMGFIALAFGGVMLLSYKHEVDKFFSVIDWDLLAFFTGLFVVINTMEHAQVLELMGNGIAAMLSLNESLASGLLLGSAAVASAVTDNIPLAAMLSTILDGQGTPTESPYWWCVIFGANLGGNITPIGSASTVVAMTIIHRNKLSCSFVDFVKVAVPFAAVQIVLAIVYVLILF